MYYQLNKLSMKTIQLVGHSPTVSVQSIMWLEGDANYTRVHFQDGSIKLITQSLHWFEKNLDFVRVHRSAIINPTYVQEFSQKKGRSGSIRLADNTLIPVSRDRLEYTASQLSLTNEHRSPSEEV
ncbi:MAG: LytTR family transcriptional regulator [Pedobacter sp.]|nr:MAG: LytTR family transcriptional regulator [Pedobacter sp.]